MEDWMAESRALGHQLRVWVIEANSSFRHLEEYDHFRVWRRKWNVGVILHQTQSNKADLQTGVEALLPALYRQGLVRIPRDRSDSAAFKFSEDMVKELTQWPDGATSDIVMAQWFGEWNLALILARAKRDANDHPMADAKIPPYLLKRRAEVEMRGSAQ
jgi:hypothetical protein